MLVFARTLHVLILAVWTGSLCCLLVIGEALQSLPSAHSAALASIAVVSELEGWALLMSPFLLGSLIVGWAPLQVALRNRVLAVLACGALLWGSRNFVTLEQQTILDALGERLEFVPPDRSAAVQWARLEVASTWIWRAEMALVVWLLITATLPPKPKRRRLGIEL